MITVRSPQRRRALSRARLLAAVLGGALACGPPTGDAPRQPGPIGSAAYAARLSASLGQPLSTENAIAIAQRERRSVEQRMAALAALLGPGESWQTVWRRLAADHPADRAALLESYRSELARARTFVAERRLAPLPDAAVEVVEVGNDVIRDRFPLALYLSGQLGVVATDDTLARHCRVCIPPLVVHEAYPGHHVAMHGLGGDVRASRYSFYLEGWAQYAELLMLEHGYYQGAAARLGAWRLVHLRTLRAETDALIHSGAIDSVEAIRRYREEGLLDEAAASSEVSRHLTEPTLKASYLLGALQLLELRRRACEEQPDLPLAELHRALLTRPGSWTEIAYRALGLELDGLGSLRLVASDDPPFPASTPP